MDWRRWAGERYSHYSNSSRLIGGSLARVSCYVTFHWFTADMGELLCQVSLSGVLYIQCINMQMYAACSVAHGLFSDTLCVIVAVRPVVVFGLLGCGVAMLVSLIGGPLTQVSCNLTSDWWTAGTGQL